MRALILLLLGGFAAYLILRALWEWYLLMVLEMGGVKTQGIVIRRYACRAPEVHWTRQYFTLFRFTVDGRDYQNRQRLSRRHYLALCPGEAMNVVCLPENPKRARLITPTRDNTQRDYVTWNALVVGIVWFVAFVNLR